MDTEWQNATIAECANICIQSFNKCLSLFALLPARQQSAIEDQLGRFSIWASNIGAFAPTRGSLDYRLREAPDVQRLLRRLLRTLNEHIQRYSSHLLGGSALEVNILDKTVDEMAEEISLMHQLSNTIRKASREGQNLKAAASFVITDEEGNDVGQVFMDLFAMDLIRRKFPGCDEAIRQRLAAAMLVRRKRILYRRSRYWKSPCRKAPSAGQKVAPNIGEVQADIQVEEAAVRQPSAPDKKPTRSAAGSQAVTATTLNIEQWKRASTPSVASRSKTIRWTHEPLDFPPAPVGPIRRRLRALKEQHLVKHQEQLNSLPSYSLYAQHNGHPPLEHEALSLLQQNISALEAELQEKIESDKMACDRGNMEVICPYCCCTLSSAIVIDNRRWVDHVKYDLDPYVCLFEDCHAPDSLYNHSEDWLKHMREHNSRWRCAAKSHGVLRFRTRDEYEEHMLTKHKSTRAQLSILAERSERSYGSVFQSCPLCGGTPTNADLENHIAEHLRYLALKSLPFIEDEDDNDSDGVASDLEQTNLRTRSTIIGDPDYGVPVDIDDVDHATNEALETRVANSSGLPSIGPIESSLGMDDVEKPFPGSYLGSGRSPLEHPSTDSWLRSSGMPPVEQPDGLMAQLESLHPSPPLSPDPPTTQRLTREVHTPNDNFNNKAERERFEQETFECGVCLELKKGANCHRLLLCSHVFCVSCLQDFYNTCITEGDVEAVRCLDPNCAKEQDAKANVDTTALKKSRVDRTLSTSELLQIPLERETVQRYVILKQKKKQEADNEEKQREAEYLDTSDRIPSPTLDENYYRDHLPRSQPSLDTFDRIPSRKLDEYYYRDHIRGRPPSASPSRRRSFRPLRESDSYEDIRITDPEFYGDGESRYFRNRPRRSSHVREIVVKGVQPEKPHPREGKTRIPRKLVYTHVIQEIGYPFEEEGDMVIIQLALSKEQIHEVISRSRKYKRAGEPPPRPAVLPLNEDALYKAKTARPDNESESGSQKSHSSRGSAKPDDDNIVMTMNGVTVKLPQGALGEKAISLRSGAISLNIHGSDERRRRPKEHIHAISTGDPSEYTSRVSDRGAPEYTPREARRELQDAYRPRSDYALMQHKLTHQSERPEEFPIDTTAYSTKGYPLRYDRNYDTLTHYEWTMVCDFCPGSVSPAKKSFNELDAFKRHLTSVHGVKQTSRYTRPTLTSLLRKGLAGYGRDTMGNCSICGNRFAMAQDLYDHLDNCPRRANKQIEPSEAIKEQQYAEAESDEEVREIIKKDMRADSYARRDFETLKQQQEVDQLERGRTRQRRHEQQSRYGELPPIRPYILPDGNSSDDIADEDDYMEKLTRFDRLRRERRAEEEQRRMWEEELCQQQKEELMKMKIHELKMKALQQSEEERKEHERIRKEIDDELRRVLHKKELQQSEEAKKVRERIQKEIDDKARRVLHMAEMEKREMEEKDLRERLRREREQMVESLAYESSNNNDQSSTLRRARKRWLGRRS